MDEKIGKFGWTYVKTALIQMIPFFCFAAIGVIAKHAQKMDSVYDALFSNTEISALSCLLAVFLGSFVLWFVFNLVGVYLDILPVLRVKEWFGWTYNPYGRVNFRYPDISRELAKFRVGKAKKVYIGCCICKYILVLSLFLPNIQSHFVESFVTFVESFVTMMILLIYNIVLDIVIGRINNKKTCPVCFHSNTRKEETQKHSSTQTVKEYKDEKIGTLKIGESKVGIYTEKPHQYEETTSYYEGVIKCTVCGNIMGRYSGEHTSRMSMETKSKIHQDISNRLNKMK